MSVFILLIKELIRNFGRYIASAAIFGILMMFFVVLISKTGLKRAVSIWISRFRKNAEFRWQLAFFVFFYMLADRTLLSRTFYKSSPFEKFMQGWFIEKKGNVYNFESVENIILYIPYIFLFFAAFFDRRAKYKNKDIIKNAVILSLCTSLIIEFLQTVFHIGTLQLSDIVYNTLGGMIGVILFMGYLRLINKFSKIKMPNTPKIK